MNRIEKTVAENKKSSKKTLVTYLMGGEFPEEKTLSLMNTAISNGADIIELGFPFSDPTADGQTIQDSAKTSLKNGTTLNNVLNLAQKFREKNKENPVILMGYFNVIFQYGATNFLKKCQECGVDGVIIVDLPIEESELFEKEAKKFGVILVQIVSFLTSKERFCEIQSRAKGFIYLISTLGVTGNALPMTAQIQEYTSSIKAKLPIFAGFGISSPEVAQQVSQVCDGVIVGSHLIKFARIGETEFAKEVRAIKNSIS